MAPHVIVSMNALSTASLVTNNLESGMVTAARTPEEDNGIDRYGKSALKPISIVHKLVPFAKLVGALCHSLNTLKPTKLSM